jgi:hypothetical protein
LLGICADPIALIFEFMTNGNVGEGGGWREGGGEEGGGTRGRKEGERGTDGGRQGETREEARRWDEGSFPQREGGKKSFKNSYPLKRKSILHASRKTEKIYRKRKNMYRT